MGVLTFAYRYLSLSGFSNDHFDHVARSWQVLHGDWPVRDFTDPGLPLAYLVSAVVQGWSDRPLLAEALLVAGAFALASALVVLLVCRLTGSLGCGLVAAAFVTVIYPRTYSYPKILLYAVAVAAGWWALERLSRGRIAVLAAVTVVAYGFRHDHGVFIGLSYLVMLAVAGGGYRTVLQSGLTYAAMTLAFVSPHLAYVHTYGGIRSYFAEGVAFSRAEAIRTLVPLATFTRPAEMAASSSRPIHVRWVPSLDEQQRALAEQRHGLSVVRHWEGTTWRYHVNATSRQSLEAIRNDPDVEDTQGLDERIGELDVRPLAWVQGANAEALIYWAFWVIPLVALMRLVRQRRTDPAAATKSSPGVALVIALAVCVDLGFIRDPLRIRLADAVLPAAVLGPWLVVTAWRAARSWWSMVAGRTTALVIVLVLAVAVVDLGALPERIERTQIWGGVAAIREQARALTADLSADLAESQMPGRLSRTLVPFFSFVRRCTAPDDRLLFVGYSPEVYFYARRGFAGGEMMFLRGFSTAPDYQRRTVERIGRQRVPFLILPASERALWEHEFGLVSTSVADRYVWMASLGDGPALVDLFVDASITVDELDAETGWPCFVTSKAMGRRSSWDAFV